MRDAPKSANNQPTNILDPIRQASLRQDVPVHGPLIILSLASSKELCSAALPIEHAPLANCTEL
jgi:hypothetical protein